MALTPFRVCALFEQIRFGMNRDILKNPTLCGAENSNKLRVTSHLVTWIPHTATVLSTSFRKSFFACCFTHKK